MKKISYLILALCVLSSSLFFSGCGGHSLSKALKIENFEYMQITADYTIVDTSEKSEDKSSTASSSSSPSSDSSGKSNHIVSSDMGDSSAADANTTTLKYKRYKDIYYQNAGSTEAYYYSQNGKYYAIISDFDDSSPDDNKKIWVRREVKEESHKNTASAFDYDAFGTLKKKDFSRKKGEYILKDKKVDDFVKSLLKIEMGKNGFDNASVKLKVENNHISSMTVEFYRNKTYRFTIAYEMSYNKLTIGLPDSYTDAAAE